MLKAETERTYPQRIAKNEMRIDHASFFAKAGESPRMKSERTESPADGAALPVFRNRGRIKKQKANSKIIDRKSHTKHFTFYLFPFPGALRITTASDTRKQRNRRPIA